MALVLSTAARTWLVVGAMAAAGPGWAGLGGPANLPPAGFQGMQFVDREGCLFLRAGSGGRMLWVPMIDDSHQPICGMPPTRLDVGGPAGSAQDPGPAPAVVRPVADVAVEPAPLPGPVADAAIPVPPKGWKLAWKDGRLNPLRGIGTANGQAMQDRVWTRSVPAVLVASSTKAARVVTRAATMSAPAASAGSGAAAPARSALFVQVGSFAVAANASGAMARIEALGLPGAASQARRGGKVFKVALAGPFSSRSAAGSALKALQSAGFGDAFIR